MMHVLRCDENDNLVGEEEKRQHSTREWLDGEDYEREKEREEDDSGDYGSATSV